MNETSLKGAALHTRLSKILPCARLQLPTQPAQLIARRMSFLDETQFVLPGRDRLRNDYKRRHRRRPEGVAHSTSFTLHRRAPPTHSRWKCIFGATIPSPVRAVVCGYSSRMRTNCVRPFAARCWLADVVGVSPLPPPPTKEPCWNRRLDGWENRIEVIQAFGAKCPSALASID